MLPPASSWDELIRNFRWSIPEHFNMAEAVERHATSPRLAMIFDDGRNEPKEFSFTDLSEASNRLANALTALGIKRGDRVAIYLPQRPEVAITHLGAWKIGALSVPLTTLFRAEALIQRMGDAAPRVVVCEAGAVAYLREEVFPKIGTTPDLIVVTEEREPSPTGTMSFDQTLAEARPDHECVKTHSSDPAFLVFTSGTTGPAKAALHPHRTLLGHLPGVQVSHDLLPIEGDRFWTPADWAWMGGFMNVVFPSLYFGLPVLAAPRRFDADEAWALAAKHGVRNSFLPPTVLKLLREAHSPATPATKFRSIASGGESLGVSTLTWARETLGCSVNEFYGQTEANLTVSNCSALFEPKAGSMGRAVPGQRVAILDENLQPVPPGEPGQICIGADSPSTFLEYFQNETGTRERVVDGWILSGDHAILDEDGHFWFSARTDDVITSSGYRIGPSEIEDCLIQHPAVRLAAVVGLPDPIRTEVVTAFIELRDGITPSAELEGEIKNFVKDRLAAYSYPRSIRFIDEIPKTTTGKLQRRQLREAAAASSTPDT